MVRKSFIGGLKARLGLGGDGAESAAQAWSPPVPAWRPSFVQPIDRVVDRMSYYCDNQRDFVVFEHGTCILLDPDLDDAEAAASALEALSELLESHPDMRPMPMDDGNILVRYGQRSASVILTEAAQAHWPEIENRHLDGLTPSEVLLTPLGPNIFDDFGKQALLGRAYMFLDARSPSIAEIWRRN
jgi:hypothetical protein